MFENNERYQEFVAQLRARKLQVITAWESRQDGMKVTTTRPPDVRMITFHGQGFAPRVLCAIVVDYGPRNGFGLFIDNPDRLSFKDDVDAIATPRPQVEA